MFTCFICGSIVEWNDASWAFKKQAVLDWLGEKISRTTENIEECTVFRIKGLICKVVAILNIWISLVAKLEISDDF